MRMYIHSEHLVVLAKWAGLIISKPAAVLLQQTGAGKKKKSSTDQHQLISSYTAPSVVFFAINVFELI